MAKPRFVEKIDAQTGERYVEVDARGVELTDQPILNKGTSFTAEERDAFGLRGLLPPQIAGIEQQAERVLVNLRQPISDLERYVHMISLLDRNETLFYRIALDHIDEVLPIIYTPTVGEACQKFGRIYRRHRGLYVTHKDGPNIDRLLSNWPYDDVAVVVITDGERILGLGDLGAGGMGISIGKSSLYVLGAGVHPARMLPMCLDVGTDNSALLDDPLYLGERHQRLRGAPYDELVEQVLTGLSRRFPRAIIQFEDFSKLNAGRLLEKYKTRVRCFNDDIQGTGAVAFAGVMSALRISGQTLDEQRVLIAGGGSAGAGIAQLLDGAQIWMFDSKGLITNDRARGEVKAFARDEPPATLHEVAARVRPTILIGVSGQAGLFDAALLGTLDGPRPIVFPLSNPTANCECTPGEARTATGGRAIVATGSPFAGTPQCNNLYIFPGVGLGALVSGAERIDQAMFRTAALTLAALAPAGSLYPPLTQIRSISKSIALAVAEDAVARKVAPPAGAAEIRARVEAQIWEPEYLPYRPAPGSLR